MLASYSISVICSSVFAMEIELLVAQLCHEVRHVLGVSFGVIAFRRWWFVCVTEPSQVRRYEREVLC